MNGVLATQLIYHGLEVGHVSQNVGSFQENLKVQILLQNFLILNTLVVVGFYKLEYVL